MELIPRDYQLDIVNQIEVGKSNLVVAFMGAGKSFISKLIIDRYKFKKVLIIVGFRKIIQQFAKLFEDEYTFILSGKDYDHSKRISLATFQTFNNRDIDTNDYDLIIQDEFHSRLSAKAEKLVFNNNATKVLLTGTPLTQSNKLIVKNIDKVINPITITEAIDKGYLAPTTFMCNSSMLGDNKKLLKTNKRDFDEATVKLLIKKDDLLDQIKKLIVDNNLASEHKTIVYVNFIETAEQLFDLLSETMDNVFIVHSKLPNKEQEAMLKNYEATLNAIVISVRSLSLGFDSPSTDRIIFGLMTKVDSLALQILWRGSRLDPNNPDKHTVVYDMTGQLATVYAYSDFSEYSKPKPACAEECKTIDDPEEAFYCLKSCDSNPPIAICNGKISSSLEDNPYLEDFTVLGKPCNKVYPVHGFIYETIIPEGSMCYLEKHTTCKDCGCKTIATLRTISAPAQMVEVYGTEKAGNELTCTFIVNPQTLQGLAVLDDPAEVKYKLLNVNDSVKLYAECVKYFKGRPFQVASSTQLKFDGVTVDPGLYNLVPLIKWDKPSNDGFIKRLIRAKLVKLLESVNIRVGYAHYQMRLITPLTEKTVMKFIMKDNLDKAKVVKFFSNLDPNKKDTFKPKPQQSMLGTIDMSSYDFGMEDIECPF